MRLGAGGFRHIDVARLVYHWELTPHSTALLGDQAHAAANFPVVNCGGGKGGAH